MRRIALLLTVTIFAVLTVTVTTYVIHMYIAKPCLFIIDPFGKYEVTNNIIRIVEYRNASLRNIVAKVVPYINGTAGLSIEIFSNCSTDVTHIVKLCGIAVKESGNVYACVNNTCITFVNETIININNTLAPVSRTFTISDYVLYLTQNGTVLGHGSGNYTYVLYMRYMSRYPTYIILCIDVNVTVSSLNCEVKIRVE